MRSSHTLLRGSSALGAHGFPTRAAGSLVSKWGDDPAQVEERMRALARAEGFDRERWFVAKQVHGACVYEVKSGDERADVARMEADALLTRVPGVVLGVSTADCTPILLRAEGVVAAVHAGWRGTVAGIAARAVEAMGGSVAAVIGPCICVRCFEVGEEVAERFDQTFVRRDLGPKPHIDLQACNAASLRAAGVATVEVLAACTFHEPERFFSYRREQGRGGGHLSFIGL